MKFRAAFFDGTDQRILGYFVLALALRKVARLTIVGFFARKLTNLYGCMTYDARGLASPGAYAGEVRQLGFQRRNENLYCTGR